MHTAARDEVDGILSDLVRTIGSDLPTDLALRAAAEALRRIAPCLAALVYRWDGVSGQLVLAASSPAGQRVAGDEAYRLGEGVVGKAALMAEGDAIGSTCVATRIASASGELLGVLAAVRARRSDPIAHLAHVAGLVGIALERARGTAEAARLAELAGVADIFERSVTGEASLSETLDAIAALALRSSGASGCAIYIAQKADADLRLAASSPRDAKVPDILRGSPAQRSGPSLAATTRDGDALVATVVRPATIGAERVAAVVLFDHPSRKAGDQEIATC